MQPTTEQLLETLGRLLDWEQALGGFEARVWDDARRLYRQATRNRGHAVPRHRAMTPTDLVREVYDQVYQATDSFEENDTGVDLAYLLGAIAKETTCEWSGGRPFVRLLRDLFPDKHPIWNHVTIDDSHASTLDERRTEAAERAWSAYDFEVGVEDASGWEIAADHWSRAVFLEEARGRPSRQQHFVVRFCPGTTEIEVVHLAE